MSESKYVGDEELYREWDFCSDKLWRSTKVELADAESINIKTSWDDDEPDYQELWVSFDEIDGLIATLVKAKEHLIEIREQTNLNHNKEINEEGL